MSRLSSAGLVLNELRASGLLELANGERRTTQVPKLDTAEQFQDLIISSCSRNSGKPGVDRQAMNFAPELDHPLKTELRRQRSLGSPGLFLSVLAQCSSRADCCFKQTEIVGSQRPGKATTVTKCH